MDVFSRIRKVTKPQTTVAAFGVSGIAPMYISRALSQLTVSHLTCGYDRSVFRHRTTRVKAQCTEPPALPVICVGLDAINKFKSSYHRHVLFVCDCADILRHPSSQPLPGKGTDILSERVKSALLAPWDSNMTVKVDAPSFLDYVDKASKPSLLRDIQTLVYKITPYALRKEIQHAVLQYLDGRISRKALFLLLDKTLRGPQLKALLQGPSAQILICALKEAKSKDTQSVADSYSIDVFDLNFVRASLDK